MTSALATVIAAMPGELALADEFWVELVAAYQEPPRYYHNFDHVAEVVGWFAEVGRGPGWVRPLEVVVAGLFHDVVYDCARSDNEVRSALVARTAIDRWLAAAPVDPARVAALIELTAAHEQSDGADLDAGHFLDSDMAIVGAEAGRFDAYQRGVEREYRALYSAADYRRGRKQFLAALAARERIFVSDYFHGRLDEQARANLGRALGELS